MTLLTIIFIATNQQTFSNKLKPKKKLNAAINFFIKLVFS